MAHDVINEKRRLHTMIDLLPAEHVHALRGLLEVMLDPVSRALATAPIEDEEINLEEEQAVTSSKEWLKHNRPISHEEILAEFGLTAADWEEMGRASLPPDSNGNG